MKGTPAIYLGRHVEKHNFRTNVYAPDGKKKLVESWASFEAAMESGLWFATREDAMDSVPSVEDESIGNATPKPKPKSKPKPKLKTVKVEALKEEESEIPHDELDDMVFEVKDGQ